MLVIVAVAMLVNLLLVELGVVNFILRVLIGLIVGRLVATFGRRFLEARGRA